MRAHMIAGGLLAGVLLSASAANAQARPNTVNMSCAQAHGVVMRAGAIVLSTGGQTYDRFVNTRGFCTPSEITKPAWVPTADAPQCFIGCRCEEYSHDIFR